MLRNNEAPSWSELTPEQRRVAVEYVRKEANKVAGFDLCLALDSLANLGADLGKMASRAKKKQV